MDQHTTDTATDHTSKVITPLSFTAVVADGEYLHDVDRIRKRDRCSSSYRCTLRIFLWLVVFLLYRNCLIAYIAFDHSYLYLC